MTPDTDPSITAIIDTLPDLDATLVHREAIANLNPAIRDASRTWLSRCELLIVVGGVGIAPSDITPEALAPLLVRPLPGFGEVMRSHAFEANPADIVHRGGAGVAGSTLVLWLPAEARACRNCLRWLAPAITAVCAALRGD